MHKNHVNDCADDVMRERGIEHHDDKLTLILHISTTFIMVTVSHHQSCSSREGVKCFADA